MDAAGGDAGKIGADVAAIGEPGAVAEQEPADHRRKRRAQRNPPGRGEASGEPGGEERAGDDAEIHDRGDVVEDAALELGEALRRRPIGPAPGLDADPVGDLRAPEREGRGDAPGPPGKGERREVADRERDRAGDKRPGTAGKAREP